MGVLNDDFYKGLMTSPAPAAPTAPRPVSTSCASYPSLGPKPNAVQAPAIVTTSSNSTPIAPGVPFGDQIVERYKPVRVTEDLSEEEQTQRFGGVVGSQQYYAHKSSDPLQYAPLQLLSAVGVVLPSQEDWDKMSLPNKAANLGYGATLGLARILASAPREIAKAPIRLGLSIAHPWVNMAQGKPGTFESLGKDTPAEIPFLGQVPTYFQTYEEARQGGMGPLASLLFTTGTAAGDVTLTSSLIEAGTSAFRPRMPVSSNGTPTVQNIDPIRSQIVREGGVVKGVANAQSTAEYYTLPESVAKQFGGTKNNTYLKVTPSSDDAVELSLVQTRGGVLQKGSDWVRTKMGIPDRSYQGDFGPEIKLQSQTVPVGGSAMRVAQAADESKLGFIPSNVVKGMETKPITSDQMANLSKIGEVNGVAPTIRDSVIRTVTGKSVMGEMTQAEYVKAAQTLGLFNNADKYVPQAPWLNPAKQFMSPQRHWMRSYEEKSGIPLYSEAYVPMEDAVRVRDVFRNIYSTKSREIFGKYAGTGMAAERQAISAYLRGEKSSIVGNAAFSTAAKNEMIDIANNLKALYDEVGPQLDVPPEIFLKDYQPHIQNIGGIFQMYKEGSDIPKELEFFAKFKRRGNFTAPQIDDSLALFDIYVNSGSNRMFLNPALKRIGALADNLPDTLKNSVRSYALEKMGYAGRLEQAFDEMVPAINKKLGLNLPPDAARQITDLALSTQYSGLLSSPGTWFRQLFQYPMFGYARLGPRFAGPAYTKALTKEGLKEVSDRGLFVDLGVPYGEELTKEITLGGRVGNTYKNITQIPIKPNSMADNLQRSVVYHQFKMQFDDAIAKYNAGKISWPQVEQALDFRGFSKVDQNIARQQIVAGNTDDAFMHLVRDVIDETNFPYRKAAGSRIGYGLGGKLATSLLQWPIEAAHTLGRWTKTGQWDKVIRWSAASVAIQRTFEDAFGFDFTRSMFLGPFGNVYSPFVQTAKNTIDALSAAVQDNREVFNENAEKIARTMQAAGMPAGVAIKNVQKFWRSYEKGVNADNLYPILDDKGEVRGYADFSDLFWGELMGFPTNQKESDSVLLKDIRNAQFDRTEMKQRIMEMFQKEQFDEAADLMAQSGINVSAQDFDDYFIPLTQRTWQALPAQLKAQFAPRVFPETKKGVQ